MRLSPKNQKRVVTRKEKEVEEKLPSISPLVEQDNYIAIRDGFIEAIKLKGSNERGDRITLKG